MEVFDLYPLHRAYVYQSLGTYYAYLFANMYAAQIWCTNFAQDPLNRCVVAILLVIQLMLSRNTGIKLWNMLKYGASRPPIEILAEMSNGPLDPKYYMQTLVAHQK